MSNLGLGFLICEMRLKVSSCQEGEAKSKHLRERKILRCDIVTPEAWCMDSCTGGGSPVLACVLLQPGTPCGMLDCPHLRDGGAHTA